MFANKKFLEDTLCRNVWNIFHILSVENCSLLSWLENLQTHQSRFAIQTTSEGFLGCWNIEIGTRTKFEDFADSRTLFQTPGTFQILRKFSGDRDRSELEHKGNWFSTVCSLSLVFMFEVHFSSFWVHFMLESIADGIIFEFASVLFLIITDFLDSVCYSAH